MYKLKMFNLVTFFFIINTYKEGYQNQRRTDNTMAKRRRTDNTMAKRRNNDLQNIHTKLKIE